MSDPETLKVWVVYVEYNEAATPEIIAVCASEELAEEMRKKEVRERIEGGFTVYPWEGEAEEDEDGDRKTEGFDDIEWDVDVHVEEHDVIGVGDPRCPKIPPGYGTHPKDCACGGCPCP